MPASELEARSQNLREGVEARQSADLVESNDARILEDLRAGKIRRVCALRASRLGDLLMTLPALHGFRQAWPGVELLFATNRYSADLLAHHPDVDELVVFDGRARDLATRKGKVLADALRAKQVDLLLALRPRAELEVFCRLAGIPRLFPARDPDADDREQHVVLQTWRRIEALLGEGQVAGPIRIALNDEELEQARGRLPSGSPRVLAHPGCDETIRWKPRSGVRRRVWPREHWRALLASWRDQGWGVIVSAGSPSETRWVDRLVDGFSVERLSGRTLRELAAVASAVDLVVTVDTGPLHLATAVDTPLLGLYGPSPVEFTGPWNPRGGVEVLRCDLPCAPCQGRGVRCLRNVCMEEIHPADVLRAAERLVASRATGLGQ